MNSEPFAFFGLLCAPGMIALAVHGCNHTQRDNAVDAMQFSADACVHLATSYGRPDLAAYCAASQDALSIVRVLLGEQRAGACVRLPQDAGTDR